MEYLKLYNCRKHNDYPENQKNNFLSPTKGNCFLLN